MITIIWVCAHLIKSYYLTKLENYDYLQISEQSCLGPHFSRNHRGQKFAKGTTGVSKVYQPFNGPTIRKLLILANTAGSAGQFSRPSGMGRYWSYSR